MKFSQMLAMEVRPLPDSRDPNRHKRANTWSDLGRARTVRCDSAIERYKIAVTSRWSSAKEIAIRMKANRDNIFKQLTIYTEKGILERRPAGGEFSQRKGWEWRVK